MNIDQSTIARYLDEVKDAVRNNRYRISMNANRGANQALFQDYMIDEAKAKQVLLGLNVLDFSEIRQNRHAGYAHEQLYISARM